MTLRHMGVPAIGLLPLPLLLARPVLARRGPGLPWTLLRGPVAAVLTVVAGWTHADAGRSAQARDCRWRLREGQPVRVVGTVVRAWSRGVVIDVRDGLPGACRVELRVRALRGITRPGPGAGVRVEGRWRRWSLGSDPALAGAVEARSVRSAQAAEGLGGMDRWREATRRRVHRLFGLRGPVVAALVLARRDGVDPSVRDGFVRAGVAHLLAISGFHVGVVALLVLAALKGAGAGRRTATSVGALVVWGYVLFIGAPDAAVRAALLLTLVGAGRLLDRPVHLPGALGSGLLLFAVADPTAAARVGFQLSFAGAAGLVYLTEPVEALLRRAGWTGWRGLRNAVAVGLAASVATLPLVAWHFGEVSVVGIPVTLAATPLVAVAIPGAVVSLGLALAAEMLEGVIVVSEALRAGAVFLAGGTDLVLAALLELVSAAGGWDGAVVPVPPSWLAAAAVGAAGMFLLARGARGVGREVRLLSMALGAAAGVILAPVGARAVPGAGLEIAVIDVGQGDAVAVRTPRGRWLLVDAGPHPPGDASQPRAVRWLRRRGVGRLDALLLTHPDLDHVGGADGVIRELEPGWVGGPGLVRGTAPYVAAVSRAGPPGDDRPWVVLDSAAAWTVDGVELEVLHPRGPEDLDPEAPNDASLVFLVRYRGFRALLTGDAPAEVEERVAAAVGPLDLLKVGHHGSRTSSSGAFLERVTPEVAVIPVGRRNRYGHPDPGVLERLERASGRVVRTDRDGTVRVRVGSGGAVRVVTERSPSD